MPTPTLDLGLARSRFPALKSGYIFADNAGGSQAAVDVIERITDYLSNTNVQLGADYSVSVESTTRVLSDGPTEAAKLFGAGNLNGDVSFDEVVFGSSSTLNLANLARGLESDISPGDEFIITGEHEANVGPWKKLAAKLNLEVKHWRPRRTHPGNSYAIKHEISDLLPLITSRTRIVAFSACSNILGTINPVGEIVKAIRAEAKKQGARKVEISVDCVAYAPHRLMDVKAWDVDFCVFSYYKVYGPHISALYVRSSVLEHSVTSLVHHFLDVATVAYKLQPGGPGYELVYGTTGVNPYLLSLTTENNLKATFDAIAAHEQKLLERLLGFLTDDKRKERGVRIVGDEKVSMNRVPTVSFVVVGDKPLMSRDVVTVFDKKGGIGIRYGHFYAYTIIDELEPKIDTANGVVRISLVHYNTLEEVDKIIAVLEEIFT
ncbi:selenocysteine lyase [Crepidotus variabilis]|uniref:Selenocysteine lyase n=1 Tax=Crepidotus variabilis TaxID=179855 RepID=A0A9P6EG83_9AGAR|nr:selenocysteine lyase [Crepidotus variabilis]